MRGKENEEFEKYQDLGKEVGKIHRTNVILVALEALESSLYYWKRWREGTASLSMLLALLKHG